MNVNGVIVGEIRMLGTFTSAEVKKVENGLVHWNFMNVLHGFGMPKRQTPQPIEEFLRMQPQFRAEGAQ